MTEKRMNELHFMRIYISKHLILRLPDVQFQSGLFGLQSIKMNIVVYKKYEFLRN